MMRKTSACASLSDSSSVGPEVWHHGHHGRHGLPAHSPDLRGREDEAVAPGVGQLYGVGVGDARPAKRPVIATPGRGVEDLKMSQSDKFWARIIIEDIWTVSSTKWKF